MKVLRVIEEVDSFNLDDVKFVKNIQGKNIYVGCSELTNNEFQEWVQSKGYVIPIDHTLSDRIILLNLMIRGGVYMFGDDVFSIPNFIVKFFKRK